VGSGPGLAGGKGVAGSVPWLVVVAVSPSGRRDATCSTTSGQRRSRRGGSSDAVAWPGGEAAAGQQQAQRARAVQRGRRQRSCPALRSSAGSERREREKREKKREVRELTLNFLKIFN